ncbi:iron ABC transporter permease [Microbacterium sp. BWT-B31]|uniref:FecCD family ABC transporter permease n=1 Tax=Microbacterium sp. BWT-B31 TaxID=3232072 RepID=UPI0035283FBD
MTAVAESATVSAPAWRRPGPGLIVVIGLIVSVVLVVGSIAIGTAGVGPADVIRTIAIRLFAQPVPSDYEATVTIIGDLRLPRALLAFIAGAALSMAGTVMQGLLRNPLVSPYTLGISPAAAFGAALAILVTRGTMGQTNDLVTILSALGMGLAVSFLVLALASFRRMTATMLILLGIALSQLFEALTSTLQYVVDEDTLSQIVRWTFGSVNSATWSQVGILAVLVALAVPYLSLNAKSLNAIAYAGDDVATSLGVNVPRTRTLLIVASVLLTAVVVSFTGIIGFVGLVGPHIARIVIGADHRHLLPFSAITGGVLLVVADTLGRTVLSPAVVPVGIVVAIIGAPIFIQLVFSRRTAAL